jgi:hypothetical protein
MQQSPVTSESAYAKASAFVKTTADMPADPPKLSRNLHSEGGQPVVRLLRSLILNDYFGSLLATATNSTVNSGISPCPADSK